MPDDSLGTSLLAASWVLAQVMEHGRSLQDALSSLSPGENRGAVQDIAYTAVRQWPRANALLHRLANGKRLKPADLHFLMCTSLALATDPARQRYEPHTLVNQTVMAADSQTVTRAGKGLVNACLRRFFREQAQLEADVNEIPSVRWACPDWWLKRLQKQQPVAWQSILEASRQAAPLTVRVNRRRTTVEAFVAACHEAGLAAQPVSGDAVWLPEPVPVHRIPGFEQGYVSVQDLAAQWAAPLLEPQNGMRVLDACCAPGGKTGHLLEIADLNLTALDVDPQRLERVEDNLRRLGLDAPSVVLKAADATDLSVWWDGQPFDAILADVPCTGSGVTRRHPDIFWLRRPTDVASMSQLQSTLVDVLWSVLRPGGTFLMVTCSIFGEEGEQLLAGFLDRHPDALVTPSPGLVLPQTGTDGPGHDGFFYARLQKRALAQA